MQTQWIDLWTVVHFLTGAIFGLFGFPRTAALFLAILYEFVEHPFQKTPEGKKLFKVRGPEVLGNKVIDVVVFELGYTWAINKKERLNDSKS